MVSQSRYSLEIESVGLGCEGMTGISDYGQFRKGWEKKTVTKKATDWVFCV